MKNKAGTFNFLKPQYSSFKFAGVQLRGKKAAQLQVIYMLITAAVVLLAFMARAAIYLLWLLALPILFVWDLLVGLVQGVRDA